MRNIGSQMLFEIIQVEYFHKIHLFCIESINLTNFKFIKDHLSNFNYVPKACKCTICLEDFSSSNDKIFYLNCYHYFHPNCFKKYYDHIEKEIENDRAEAVKNRLKWVDRRVGCAVCREQMTEQEIEQLKSMEKNFNKSSTKDNMRPNQIQISDKTRKLQKEMSRLFEKQKLAGGIIELNRQEDVIILNVNFFFILIELYNEDFVLFNRSIIF
jgi:hypothetical protein